MKPQKIIQSLTLALIGLSSLSEATANDAAVNIAKPKINLEKLEQQAENYRLVVTRCLVDMKMEKKHMSEVKSCIALNAFLTDDYPRLRKDFMQAEIQLKADADKSGLKDSNIRDQTVFLMSTKSQMSMAAALLDTIEKASREYK